MIYPGGAHNTNILWSNHLFFLSFPRDKQSTTIDFFTHSVSDSLKGITGYWPKTQLESFAQKSVHYTKNLVYLLLQKLFNVLKNCGCLTFQTFLNFSVSPSFYMYMFFHHSIIIYLSITPLLRTVCPCLVEGWLTTQDVSPRKLLYVQEVVTHFIY